MVINVGGLWERPTTIADGSEVFPSIYSEFNFIESQETGFRSPNREAHASQAHCVDNGAVNNSSESLTVTEWPDHGERSLLYKGSVSSVFKNNFHPNDIADGWRDSKAVGRRKAMDTSHISAGSGPENICIHASRALRVRSSARKDRHSKVNTAKGLRDRRVRLTVSTALQFYDIQHRLEFDQPSQTLDWLLRKAKYAIDQLPRPSTISKPNCLICNTNLKMSMSNAEALSTPRAEISGNNTDGPSGIPIPSQTSINSFILSRCEHNNAGQGNHVSSTFLQTMTDVGFDSANNVECFSPYSSQISDIIPAPLSLGHPTQHNVTSSSVSPLIVNMSSNAFHLTYENGERNNLSEEYIPMFDYPAPEVGNIGTEPAWVMNASSNYNRGGINHYTSRPAWTFNA